MIERFLPKRPLARRGIEGVLIVILLALGYASLFGPKGESLERQEFLVTPEESLAEVTRALAARDFIGNTFGFSIAYAIKNGSLELRPGGYELSSGMDAWTVAEILAQPPRLAWVRIPEGYRKEQIAELFGRTLGWTEEEQQEWLTVAAVTPVEGEYFPDIYLIPSDQSMAQVANRMRERLAHEGAELKAEANRQGIAWNKVLTIASLIQREAAGPHDMQLISGIIWNRLEIDMPLGIDATLQYIRGASGKWWPIPTSEDKYLESPYNTYFKPGLPPYPIANPGLDAIHAVLHPKETGCYYYLHDYQGDIHCASNYKAHVANVNRYLK